MGSLLHTLLLVAPAALQAVLQFIAVLSRETVKPPNCVPAAVMLESWLSRERENMETFQGIPCGMDQAPMTRSVGRPLRHRFFLGVLAGVAVYLALSMVVLPAVWRRYESRHPALSGSPTVTHTGIGIPGDPLNIGLVGSEEQVHRGMLAAGWYAADPVTLATSLRIAADVVFKRPFDEAPVSPLYLFGRKQDMAFEKPIGDNPRSRHHVRFWRSEQKDDQGRILWLGAATLDRHVGLSRDTGQVTHVIDPDVDADRDLILSDLRASGALESEYWIDGFQKMREGKNGEGDPWRTDGRLGVGVLGRAGG